MTSDPTYTPSPALVEALRDAQAQSWGWSSWSVMYVEDQTVVISDTDAFLTAAVAFRHPDGRPELVPWEQARSSSLFVTIKGPFDPAARLYSKDAC